MSDDVTRRLAATNDSILRAEINRLEKERDSARELYLEAEGRSSSEFSSVLTLQAERDRLAERVKDLNEASEHWRVKAECYKAMVSGCTPALAAAGIIVDATGHGGAVVGIRVAVERLAAERDAALAQVAMLREALEEIAHAPEYDGSLCPDPDDCPNCFARKTLAATADAK